MSFEQHDMDYTYVEFTWCQPPKILIKDKDGCGLQQFELQEPATHFTGSPHALKVYIKNKAIPSPHQKKATGRNIFHVLFEVRPCSND